MLILFVANPKPPEIDGKLDDEAWKSAPKFEGFTQHDPNEGEPATERTVFQILYDNEAVYFGVECYDSEPDKITSRLMRRDSEGGADSVSINLDPRYDHQTGYWFTAQVSGSVSDGVIFNDGMNDSSWDGVWEVKTSIHDQGWTAEYRIPYHVLRFNPKEEYTWGFNVERSISRKKEFDQWELLDRNHSGRVSRWGILEGNSHIGLMTTAVNRKDSESAYVGTTDWSLKFHENKYEFSRTLAASHAGESDDRKSGYITHFEFDRKGGWWGGKTGISAISPGLDTNDLGIIRRNNRIRWWIDSGINRDKRLGIFRRGGPSYQR